MKLVLLALVFALSAIAQKIEIESDQSVDFSKFKTFAIRDGRLNSTNPSLNGELIQKRLNADIQKALEAKGLTFVDSGPADLNRGVSGGLARLAHAGCEGPLYGRQLVIDLRDPSTKSLVWRAIAREEKSDARKSRASWTTWSRSRSTSIRPRRSRADECGIGKELRAVAWPRQVRQLL